MENKKLKSVFSILVSREAKNIFSVKKLRYKEADWLGMLLTLLTVVGLGACFILLLNGVISGYTSAVLNTLPESAEVQHVMRQRELMSVCYLIITIAGIIFGINKINRSLNYDKEMEILLRLPVTMQDIFLSKLITLYLGQIVFVSTMVLPINISFAIVSAQTVWFWFGTFFTCLLLPSISFLLAALLALPVKYLINYLKSKYLLILVLFVGGLGVAFYAYSKILVLIENYFVSGQIKYVFNEQTLNVIMGIAKYSYPVNCYADMIYNERLLINILIVVLCSAACLGLIFLVTRKLFRNYLIKGATRKTVFNKKTRLTSSSPFMSLMKKEFLVVFRTPDYTFSYFATALVLPLMAYCCVELLTRLILQMLGMSFNLEISLLVIAMFAVLTNTFCASNISRDGENFLLNKSLPLSGKQIIFAKLVFCTIINVVSLLATCLLLLFTKYIDVSQFFIIFPLVVILTCGETMMATAKDLSRPRFNFVNNPDEGNRSTSFTIIIGMLVAAVLGVAAIGLTFALRVYKSVELANLVTPLALFGIALIYLGITAFSLFFRLDKKLSKIVG